MVGSHDTDPRQMPQHELRTLSKVLTTLYGLAAFVCVCVCGSVAVWHMAARMLDSQDQVGGQLRALNARLAVLLPEAPEQRPRQPQAGLKPPGVGGDLHG